MTAARVVFIECDGGGDIGCTATIGPDSDADTGRWLAVGHRWLVRVKNPDGRPLDYCPEHRHEVEEDGHAAFGVLMAGAVLAALVVPVSHGWAGLAVTAVLIGMLAAALVLEIRDLDRDRGVEHARTRLREHARRCATCTVHGKGCREYVAIAWQLRRAVERQTARATR